MSDLETDFYDCSVPEDHLSKLGNLLNKVVVCQMKLDKARADLDKFVQENYNDKSVQQA